MVRGSEAFFFFFKVLKATCQPSGKVVSMNTVNSSASADLFNLCQFKQEKYIVLSL